jgi:MFS transporter, BCD family, chlorophyll transporter
MSCRRQRGWLARCIGSRPTAGIGLAMASLSFLLLAAAGWRGEPGWLAPAILLMGLGMGLSTVGGLALMISMAVKQLTGLYMGTWALAQALGNGLASIGCGLLSALGLRLLGEQTSVHALVFLPEAVGLLAATALLRRISLGEFRSELDEEGAFLTAPA